MHREWKDMTNYNRGDIVLVRFPMPDLKKYKPRPALIIQNDTNNEKLANTILLQITSNLSNKDLSTQYYIDIDSDEGKASGLLTNSVVKAEVIFTLPQKSIYKKIGSLSDNAMKEIDRCMKYSLSLE